VHRLISSWLIVLLALPLLGCIEDFSRIRETDMPRIAVNDREVAMTSPLPADRFNARALWDHYGVSVLQADLDCKGKTLRVSGIVRSVATDDRHRAYIGFQVFEPAKVPASRLRTMSAKEKTWIQEGYPPLVICYLVPTEPSKLATLKKGQTVQLLGRCLGRVKDPSGFKDYVVVLDSCRLEE